MRQLEWHAQYNWVGVPLSAGLRWTVGIVYCTYVGLHKPYSLRVLCANIKGKGRCGHVQLKSHTPVNVAYAIVGVCTHVALAWMAFWHGHYCNTWVHTIFCSPNNQQHELQLGRVMQGCNYPSFVAFDPCLLASNSLYTIGFTLAFVPQIISNVNYSWAVLAWIIRLGARLGHVIHYNVAFDLHSLHLRWTLSHIY